MFGGVAGHAGLFSNAYDIAVIMQMLMNGGEFNGKHYLQKETVELFTAYQSNISRRGYGFDKPEKDQCYPPRTLSLSFCFTTKPLAIQVLQAPVPGQILRINWCMFF